MRTAELVVSVTCTAVSNGGADELVPPNRKTAPRIKFGRSAATIRPPMSMRMLGVSVNPDGAAEEAGIGAGAGAGGCFATEGRSNSRSFCGSLVGGPFRAGIGGANRCTTASSAAVSE